MYRIIIIFLFLIFGSNLIAQNDSDWKNEVIKSLSIYRTNLLHSNVEDLHKLNNTLNTWREWEPNREKLIDFIFITQYTYMIQENSFNWVKKKAIKEFPESELAINFTEDQLKSITDNSELADLIIFEIISDKYPFQIIPNLEVFDELEFYNVEENDVIAEIGAGKGVFSYLLTMMNKNPMLYINEIDEALIEYMIHQITKNNLNLDINKIRLIEGSKKDLKIPEKVDKVIIRNSFHHFSKKKRMLKSIQETLKKDGSLFIFEPLKSEKNSATCKYRMSEDEIKSVLNDSNFQLKNELRIGDNLYLEYKPI